MLVKNGLFHYPSIRVSNSFTSCTIFHTKEPNQGLVMGHNDDVSRRSFLQRISIIGVAGVGGSTLLSACGGGSEGQEGGSEQAQTSEGGGQAAADLDCDDLSALSDAQMQQRSQMAESLNYVAETPNPEQNCANCALYQQPDAEETTDNACGGCQLFPGPVYPNGYCTSWAPAA